MRQALIALLALATISVSTHSLPAADVQYPVQGEWVLCSPIVGIVGCNVLQIGETVVSGSGKTLCTGVSVKKLGPSLAVVECHSDAEGMLQYYFLFDSEKRARFWSMTSRQGDTPASYVLLAQRRLDGPIPAELLGRWYVSHWTPVQEYVKIDSIEFRKDSMTITHPRRSEECRAAQLPSSPEEGADYAIEIIFGHGSATMLPLYRISQGEFIASAAGQVILLHRDERPPSWFASELMKSCDAITDPSLRDKCYARRSLCDMVPAGSMNPLCLELVKRPEEVMKNLDAIRELEMVYSSEYQKWVGNQPFTPVADRTGNNSSVAWVNTTRFSILGFAPEGDVQCSYALEGSDFPSIQEGFTAKAQCDLDANGKVSEWSVTGRSNRIQHSGDDF